MKTPSPRTKSGACRLYVPKMGDVDGAPAGVDETGGTNALYDAAEAGEVMVDGVMVVTTR